jgi:hypothetical protein
MTATTTQNISKGKMSLFQAVAQPAEHLLQVKAGRCLRDGETNWVRPSIDRGMIVVDKGEDELMHIYWKDLNTNQTRQDLIVFPQEARFFKVAQSSGRVYALQYHATSQIHFYWMQYADETQDALVAHRIQSCIDHPDQDPNEITSVPNVHGMLDQSMHADVASAERTDADSWAQLQQLMSTIHVPSTDVVVGTQLDDVLTPQVLDPLFQDPVVCASLFQLLPQDIPQTPQELKNVVRSTPFRHALAGLSLALESGQLAPLMHELGLPVEASQGVGAFLLAISNKVRQQQQQHD